MNIIEQILERNDIKKNKNENKNDIFNFFSIHNEVLKRINILDISKLIMSFAEKTPKLIQGIQDVKLCPYVVLRDWRYAGRTHIVSHYSTKYLFYFKNKYGDFENPEFTKICTCKHKPLKWNCYIVRPDNKKVLVLGSSCVKNFYGDKVQECVDCAVKISFDSRFDSKLRCKDCKKKNRLYLNEIRKFNKQKLKKRIIVKDADLYSKYIIDLCNNDYINCVECSKLIPNHKKKNYTGCYSWFKNTSCLTCFNKLGDNFINCKKCY